MSSDCITGIILSSKGLEGLEYYNNLILAKVWNTVVVVIIIIIIIIIIKMCPLWYNNLGVPETKKYWVDIQRGIVSSHGERDPP